MISHKDTPADIEIKTCIDNRQNFAVVAGAGSGKTGSLIKALSHVRNRHGKSLRAASQKVVCITYTNAAVDIIKQRMNLDELFVVSTIHSFLWSLIENYQSDIRSIVKEKLIPRRIKKKQADDNGGQSKKARKAHQQVEALKKHLNNIDSVDKFIYDDRGRRDYSAGYLNHEDIIDLVSIMILERPHLQRIIGQKFPYIFVDEAQDIFDNVMKALNQVASINGLPLIGYFGDPMQQIYENRVGQFYGPEGYQKIQKI
jgi:DNA helicase-2/ATP-dependent DNA helicase PcrA